MSERRIARQKFLIERLPACGLPTAAAEDILASLAKDILASMEETQDLFEAHWVERKQAENRSARGTHARSRAGQLPVMLIGKHEADP